MLSDKPTSIDQRLAKLRAKAARGVKDHGNTRDRGIDALSEDELLRGTDPPDCVPEHGGT